MSHNNHNNNRLIRPNPVRSARPEERYKRRQLDLQPHTALGTSNLAGSNSDLPWGLMGDARPPTPSEGRAQDLVAEPFGPAFDSQFNEINQAVRDLQLSNGQAHNAPTNANAEYKNFRTHQPDPRSLQQVRYPDGNFYRVVPSQYASVEVIPHVRSLVRHLSERPGEAHTGDSTDTRFGENRGPAMSQKSATALDQHQGALLNALIGDQNESPANATNVSEDIEEEGPIYYSRGTFYPGPQEPGYPPGYSNVPRRTQDIGGRDYQAEGHTSMLQYLNVPSGARDFGNRQHHQIHGHGGYGRSGASLNVPRHSEDIQRGRRIDRNPDPKYYKSHRKTQRRAALEWGLELDRRNDEDRRRGETILGGDVDSGEVHTFWRFGAPFYEQRTPRAALAAEEEGFATPRALGPAHPQFTVTEASPLPSAQQSPPSYSGSTLPIWASFKGNLASRHTSAPLLNTDRFQDTSFSRILNVYDQNRISQSPTMQAASEARSSSAESSENSVFGEQAGTVRALSKTREEGRRLYEK
ncbi:hypothetical protein BKA65DRAFT_543451 [Rhexocercosporidium sp. MPI-PUGE-AT-0058]|nr:hypothetical protein BKA65DRAFT_543451 [Rhexocercosporidium sp. MPI-PUGE-AT-0058]